MLAGSLKRDSEKIRKSSCGSPFRSSILSQELSRERALHNHSKLYESSPDNEIPVLKEFRVRHYLKAGDDRILQQNDSIASSVINTHSVGSANYFISAAPEENKNHKSHMIVPSWAKSIDDSCEYLG